MKDLSAEVIYRSPGSRRCTIRRFGSSSAREAIGELTPGMELFGFTKGQFSFTDVLVALLEQTGPADVAICTWTAHGADLTHCHDLLRSGDIRSMRFVTDLSFESRKPEFMRELIERFGLESIRVTSTHAKFSTIRNEKYDLVVRTSMNMNKNPRFENFEISDDAAFADFQQEVFDEIFDPENIYSEPGRSCADYRAAFRRIGNQDDAPETGLFNRRDTPGELF